MFYCVFNGEDDSVGNGGKQSEPQVGKVLVSKARVGKVKTNQTIGGLSILIPVF